MSICLKKFVWCMRFFANFWADAVLIDGSLECKFLAYFGTILYFYSVYAQCVEPKLAPYNIRVILLWSSYKMYMKSIWWKFPKQILETFVKILENGKKIETWFLKIFTEKSQISTSSAYGISCQLLFGTLNVCISWCNIGRGMKFS